MSSSLQGILLNAREFDGVRLSRTAYAAGAFIDNHCHDIPHICLVTSGAFEETCEDRIDALQADSVLLHGPRQHHANLFHTQTTCFNVEFDPDWTKRFGVAFSTANPVVFRNDAVLAFLLREMDSMFGANRLFGKSMAIAYALSVLKRAVELCDRGSVWQAELAASIAKQYWRAIDLDALSALVGLHPSYVARAFRRKTGKTLTAFLHEIRVHKAAQMLLDDDGPSLADIALAVGFADQAHFTRVFRRIAGAPPGEFRRLRGRQYMGQ